MENNQIVLNDEIINKAKEGDRNALALLCKKSMQSAYFMALKILKNEADAEDIVSESMITIIEKIGYLQEAKAYDSWVNQIVVNKCYNHIKKMKPVLCGDYSDEYIDNADLEEYNKEFLPEEFAVDKEKRKVLMDVIKEVTNEMEMMSIVMFYYNDESISSIANSMNCAEITVKKRLASGRKKIKEGIERKYGKGVVFMAIGIITVLSQVMKAEASETTIPASTVANVMSAAGKAATELSNMKNINGGLQMNNDMYNGMNAINNTSQTAGGDANVAGTTTNATGVAGNAVGAVGNATSVATGAGNVVGAVGVAGSAAVKAGLSGGAIAGICSAIVAVLVALGIVAAFIFGGKGSDDDDDFGINNGTTTYIEAESNSTTVVDEDDTDEDVTDETTEEITTEETTTSSFVPEVFERYDVPNLGFVAPSAHTEANEECTFLWSRTEDDALNWAVNNFKAKDNYKYTVRNETGIDVFDVRSVWMFSTLENDDSLEFSVETSSYNKNVISYVRFYYEGKELNRVIESASKFVEFMGFNDYTEQIIHNDNYIKIDTENKLGEYEIETSYYVIAPHEEYALAITISYSDYDFKKARVENGVVPEKMETWDDYYNLSDYFTETSFNASNTEEMAKNIGKYAVEIGMNNTLKYVGPYLHQFKYSYTSVDTSITTDIDVSEAWLRYVFEGKNSTEDKNLLDGVQTVSFNFEYKDCKFDNLYMAVDLTPIYEHGKQYENQMSDDAINNLNVMRLPILKRIKTDIEITKDDLVKSYMDDEGIHLNYSDEDARYYIYSDFDGLVFAKYAE